MLESSAAFTPPSMAFDTHVTMRWSRTVHIVTSSSMSRATWPAAQGRPSSSPTRAQ
jgi:hypothetical protein